MKILIIVVAFLFASSAPAETIRLVNGKEVEGTIIRSNASNITVRTRTGVSTYQLSEVERSSIPETALPPSKPNSIASSSPVMKSGADDFIRSFRDSMARTTIGIKITFCLWFIGSVWFTIVAFRVSIPWGFFMFFFNWIAVLIFSAFHWKEAWRPLLVLILAILVMIATCEWTFVPHT
jgi:hypothetical protein